MAGVGGGLSAEHAMSKTLPAPRTFAPSKDDVSALPFAPTLPNPEAVPDLVVQMAGALQPRLLLWRSRCAACPPDPRDRCANLSLTLTLACAAVPEKLRDYSEHHVRATFPHRPPTAHQPLTSQFPWLAGHDLPLPGRVLRPEHQDVNRAASLCHAPPFDPAHCSRAMLVLAAARPSII